MMEIVFTSGRGPLGTLIRWFTQSKVSHVVLRVFDYFAFEANGRGVSLKPYHEVKYITARFRIRTDLIEKSVVEKTLQETLYKHGKGYDWLGIIGFAYCIIMERIFKKNVKNPLATQSSYWCSELIAYFLNQLNSHKDIGLNINPEEYSPEDLLKLVRSRPDLFEEIHL